MKFIGRIVIASATAENSTTAEHAVLDLATKTTHVNTVVEAVVGGSPGNGIKWTFRAGAPAALVLTVDPVALTVDVHFKTNDSDITALEAAITALAGIYKIVRVKTAGTGATKLMVTADEFAAAPMAGGVSLAIPAQCPRVRVITSAADVSIETDVDPLAVPGTVSAKATTAARGLLLQAGVPLDIPVARLPSPSVLLCYSSGGATVRMWALDA